MQKQGIYIVLFVFFILPIVIFFTNHDSFFIIMSVILFVSSFNALHSKLFKIDEDEDNEDSETVKMEIEEMTDLDIKKFSTGTKVVRSMFAILFFLYSSFLYSGLILKALFSFLILHRLYNVIESVVEKDNHTLIISSIKVKTSLEVMSSALTLILIALTFYTKFIELNYFN